MHINQLPEDVLVIVLRQASRYTTFSLAEWKHKLPLLAICRQWRALALPVMFCTVGVEYNTKDIVMTKFTDADEPTEPTDAQITTNADLVAFSGHTQLVRRAELVVNHFASPFPGLTAVMNMLYGLAPEWLGTKSLMVQMYCNIRYQSQSAIDYQLLTSESTSFASRLAQLLPNVSHIKLLGSISNPANSIFYSKLATAYSHQLSHLASRHSLSIGSHCNFDNLTYLSVEVGSKAPELLQLPRVLSKSLKSMRLSEVPCNFNWANFADMSNSQAINFSELKRLELSYATEGFDPRILLASDNHATGHPILHFPRLEYLKLQAMHPYVPLVKYGVFARELGTLDFHGSIAALRAIGQSIPKLGRLTMGLSFNSSDTHTDPFLAINQISESAQAVTENSLLINNDLYNYSLPHTSCSALTKLGIFSLIAGDNIPALIQSLPNLRDLVILHATNVDSRLCSAVACYKPPSSRATIQPINFSLRRLTLKFSMTTSTKSAAGVLVKYLLLRLPSLEYLQARQVSGSPIRKLINNYGNQYSHMGQVELALQAEQ